MADTESQRKDSSYGWLALVAIYAAAGWAAVEILSTFREILALPERLDTVLLAIFIGGFPAAVFIYWWRGRRRQTSAIANAAFVLMTATLLAVISIGLLHIFSADEAELPSVAVLPCQYDGDPEYAYIGLGFAEEVHDRLARLSGLRVVGWRSVRNVQKIETEFAAIAARLDVERLASCEVEYAEDNLRVTARIIDPGQGTTWSNEYQYASVDLTRVLVELAEAVATELSVQMTDDELRQVRSLPTISAEAYRLFLKARADFDYRSILVGSFYVPWMDEDGYQRARELYARALELDPEFARAWAGLAMLHYDYATLVADSSDSLDPEEFFALAVSSADRALALDVCSADAILVKTDQSDMDCLEFEAEFIRASECEPGNVQAWAMLGNLYRNHQFCDVPLKDPFEKLRVVRERALKMDPTNCMLVTRYLRWSMPLAGSLGALPSVDDDPPPRDEIALMPEVRSGSDKIRALLLMDPGCSDAYQMMADTWRGRLRLDIGLAWNYKLHLSEPDNPVFADMMASRYFELGMLEQTLAWAEKATELSQKNFADDPFGDFYFAAASFFLGNPDPAYEILEEILQDGRKDDESDFFFFAMQTFLQMGDVERAAQVLVEATELFEIDDLVDFVPRPPSRFIGGKMEAIDAAIAARAAGMKEQSDRLLAMAYRDNPVEPLPTDLSDWQMPTSPARYFHYLDARHRAVTGKESEALDLLEYAIATRQGYVGEMNPQYYEALSDPAFASLRERPEYSARFQKIMDDYEKWLRPMQETVKATEISGDWDTLALYHDAPDP